MNAKKPNWDDQQRTGSMGRARTILLVIVVTALAVVAIGAMVKAMDSAHGGVVEAPRP